MGLKPDEVKRLTLKDFSLMLTGFLAKEDRAWNRTRHIMAYLATYSGMGSSEFVRPQDIYPLPMDREGEKKMITTEKQALELLKEFDE